jgi:hypothetical protein
MQVAVGTYFAASNRDLAQLCEVFCIQQQCCTWKTNQLAGLHQPPKQGAANRKVWQEQTNALGSDAMRNVLRCLIPL